MVFFYYIYLSLQMILRLSRICILGDLKFVLIKLSDFKYIFSRPAIKNESINDRNV